MADFTRIGHFLFKYPLLNMRMSPVCKIQIIILLIDQFIKSAEAR